MSGSSTFGSSYSRHVTNNTKKKLRNSSLLTTRGSWISLTFCEYVWTWNMVSMFLMLERLIMTWPLLCNYHTSYELSVCKDRITTYFMTWIALTKKVENKFIFTLHYCSTSDLQLNCSSHMNIREMQSSRFVEIWAEIYYKLKTDGFHNYVTHVEHPENVRTYSHWSSFLSWGPNFFERTQNTKQATIKNYKTEIVLC